MAEARVDISTQESNLLSELLVDEFDWVITLCGHASEICPSFPSKRAHAGFDDPLKLATTAVSKVAISLPTKE